MTVTNEGMCFTRYKKLFWSFREKRKKDIVDLYQKVMFNVELCQPEDLTTICKVKTKVNLSLFSDKTKIRLCVIAKE
jgi:hypothetical protein